MKVIDSTCTYKQLWVEGSQSHLPSSVQLRDVEHNQANAHSEGCYERILSAHHLSF